MPTLSPDQKFLLHTKIKHFVAKAVSIILLLSGLRGLILSLMSIFQYSQEVQFSAHLAYGEFHMLLKKFVVEGTESLVESTYGLILLAARSEKIKLVSIILGIALAVLPWVINEPLLHQAEQSLPQVFHPTIAFAQTTSPQQALADYQFQLQKYREAHREYISAKNLYLSFQTLNAKTEAIDKTNTLLIRRAEAIRSYLFALRVTLNATPSVPAVQKTDLSAKLTAQEQFLSAYQKDIPAIIDTTAITQASLKLETIFPQIQILGYQTLAAIILAEQQSATDHLKAYHGQLQQLIATAPDAEVNKPQANQWLADIQSMFTQNQQSYIGTQQQLAELKPQDSDLISNQRDFAKIINNYDLSKSRLATVINYLKETINLLKYD